MSWKRAFVILICAVLAPLVFIHIFDSINVSLQGMELSLGLQLAEKGSTTIHLPPIGVLKAYTHSSPITLKIVLQNVDIDVIKAIIDSIHDKNELISLIKEDALNAIKILAAKTLLLSISGTFFAAFVLRLKKRDFICCTIISIALVIIILSWTFLSYNVTAFDKPEYFGTLRAAPWLIDIWNKGISQINVLREQLKSMSEGISMVFSRMDSVASTEESMVRVLHVSDIHNNPAAFDFMEQIVQNFNVDFIIDTGDITDYGTYLE
ncbi:MAG: metallophosphoesterase, partial [Tepidanaerobacteraceae bacterium]